MNQNYCIILTTFESENQSLPVIDKLIEERLVACIQIMPIKSKYFWDGAVCCDNEVLVFMKTKESLYERVKEMILDLHPYETPEVLKPDIADGSKSYLDWIKDVTVHE